MPGAIPERNQARAAVWQSGVVKPVEKHGPKFRLPYFGYSLRTQRSMERERRFEARLRRQAERRGYRLVPMDENAAV